MQGSPSPAIRCISSGRLVSAKTLRQWCAPELILAITDLSDELVLMPHLINQARHSQAKIILAYLLTPTGDGDQRQGCARRACDSHAQQARTALNTMARRLRWLGFTCEPLVLSGRPEVQLPSLVRMLSISRAVLTMEDNPESSLRRIPTLAEQVLTGLEIPTCIIGRYVSSSNAQFIRNITLAVSFDSDCEIPLGFACRLAQEHRARLTVFHASQLGKPQKGSIQTPAALAAHLPSPTWREAELFCPTDIALRPGDPAEETLNHCAATRQDLLILCSNGKGASGQNWRSSVAYRILAGAQCPIFVMGRHGVEKQPKVARNLPERITPRSEHSPEDPTKEEVGARYTAGARSVF